MLYLERQYISLLSPRLQNFKKKSESLFNFRCPFCGDSEKKTNKMRGYLYEKRGTFAFYCHNCHAASGIHNFIKNTDPVLYGQFLRDQFKESKIEEQKSEENRPADIFDGLKTMSKISPFDPATKYLRSRKLPTNLYNELFYVDKFKKFTNNLIPGKYKSHNYDEPRILIPFYTSEMHAFGYTGRSVNPDDSVRYMTIITDDRFPKLYGMHKVNLNKRFYVTEGAFDSMFLENAMAAAGSDIHTCLKSLNFNKQNCVVVFDNEPRNKDIISGMKKCARINLNVCVWPKDIAQKDINQMILSGLTSSEIQMIIDRNTFHGLQANAKISEWSRA